MFSDKGAVDFLNKPARLQLRVLQQFDREPRHTGGNASRLQRHHRKIRTDRHGPLPDCDFDAVLFRAAAFGGGERAIRSEIGAVHDLAQGAPFRVVAHRQRNPLILTEAGEASVRNVKRVAIADTRAARDGMVISLGYQDEEAGKA